MSDGGPAYPCTVLGELGYLDGQTGLQYLDQPDTHYTGMTLRDHFAGQALAGLLTNDATYSRTADGVVSEVVSKLSYQIAHAMLAERDK